ncbi:acetylhydrolase [Dactylosporangium sp. NPDC005555]|uniref:alpha/beta hydrolase family protein n=1 Tax=Dactylosporangium sp. NPDC005555 TaxID=3154889 RepID=UPI00339DD299
MTASLTRRHLLAAALAAGVAAPFAVPGSARAAGPAQLTLPAPTGPYPVGVVPLHVVGSPRPRPGGGPPRRRELMISVWYPAQAGGRHPRAEWLAPAALRAILEANDFPADAARTALTAARVGAPVRRGLGKLPVIVYSHGAHDHRGDHTIIVQELAAHGYVVVTVGHTGDTFAVFPDGRLVVPEFEPGLGAADFAYDIPFVLDRVEDLAAGRNPDVDHRPLPSGLCGGLDLRRIGMFGSSKGGTATVITMSEDRRVKAGLSLDAPMEPTQGIVLDRPFLLMTAEYTREAAPVAELWSHLTGWRRNLHVDGAAHNTYGDYRVLIPQLAAAIGMSDEELAGWVGTFPIPRAVRIQQAYPLAFFDLHLRHRGHLLDGPSPAFPEVRFIP